MLASAVRLRFHWQLRLIKQWVWFLSMLVTMASTLVDLRDNGPINVQSADWTLRALESFADMVDMTMP